MCLTCEGLSTQILWPTLEHFKKTDRWAVEVEPPVADEVGLVEHCAIGTEETVPGCRFCVYFQINCLNVNVNLWMIRRLYIKFSLLLLVAFQKKSGGKKNLTLSNHRCHRWRRCGTVGTRPPGLHNNLWFESSLLIIGSPRLERTSNKMTGPYLQFFRHRTWTRFQVECCEDIS